MRSVQMRGLEPRSGLPVIHLLASLCLLVGLFQPAAPVRAADPVTRYVNPAGGSDTGNDCSNLLSPCKTIQHAIDSANLSDDIIDLAAGTYHEHLVATKNVNLTYSGPSRCRPPLQICSVTLDGDGTGRVLEIASMITVSISNVTIQNGMVEAGQVGGAGILNFGTLRLNHVTLRNNWVKTSSNLGLADIGGAIHNQGRLYVVNSQITGNRSDFNGGGIASYGSELSIEYTSINNNTAGDSGGGLYTIGSSTTLNQVSIIGNTAADRGGGIFTNAYDGAYFNMNDSTISGNVASNPGHSLGNGGGIFIYQYFTLTNVTITGNRAGEKAGAFYLDYGAKGVFDHVTIAGNDTYSTNPGRVSTGGGVGEVEWFQVRNSIITGPADAQKTCEFENTTYVLSSGRNLISDATCLSATGNRLANESEAKLGPLGDYGGNTQTMPLLAGSPAIDASLTVDPITDPSYDQRRFRRQGAADIGAFEQLTPPSISAVFQPGSAVVGQPVNLVIMLSNLNESPAPFSGLSFTLNLPEGLEVASVPAEPVNPCNGVLTAAPGGKAITLTSGYLEAAPPPPAACEIRVQVKAVTAGDYLMTVPGAGAYAVGAGAGAQASLTVQYKIYLPMTRRP